MNETLHVTAASTGDVLVSNVSVNVNTFVSESTGTRARSMPSPRHGSQAYFWTPQWQQKELVADFDFLADNFFEPADIDDAIRHLHEGADAQAS